MPATKWKKEDLVQAGKAVGQTKLSFAKNSKMIDEVSYLPSSVHRSSAKFFFFNSSQIDVTAWSTTKSGLSLVRIFLYIDRIVSIFSRIWKKIYNIRENMDMILSIYGETLTRKSPYFNKFHPVCTITISVMLILIWHKAELCIYVFFILTCGI